MPKLPQLAILPSADASSHARPADRSKLGGGGFQQNQQGCADKTDKRDPWWTRLYFPARAIHCKLTKNRQNKINRKENPPKIGQTHKKIGVTNRVCNSYNLLVCIFTPGHVYPIYIHATKKWVYIKFGLWTNIKTASVRFYAWNPLKSGQRFAPSPSVSLRWFRIEETLWKLDKRVF